MNTRVLAAGMVMRFLIVCRDFFDGRARKYLMS